MARLENITGGTNVTGIAGDSPVSVVAVKWYGANAMTGTFKKADGSAAGRILYREDEERLSVADGNLLWGFDAEDQFLFYEDVIKLIHELKPKIQFIFTTHNLNIPFREMMNKSMSAHPTVANVPLLPFEEEV